MLKVNKGISERYDSYVRNEICSKYSITPKDIVQQTSFGFYKSSPDSKYKDKVSSSMENENYKVFFVYKNPEDKRRRLNATIEVCSPMLFVTYFNRELKLLELGI
jgi:hypothetical protein